LENITKVWKPQKIEKKRDIKVIHKVTLSFSQSEPAATSAPVRDEAVQAILGMNPNTSK
jgi:hypothetical protein